ncbi:phage tail tape measure protein [Bradyrhizobium barranii]|uniref:phage tail tape measure protein n=1 Tax=Bradyrhizobium TaxID=374 RepID=UPI003F204AF7
MSQQVVTELVIDSDTSGADQFSSAMDRAGTSSRSAQASVAQMTLALAGVGVAVIAAVQGLRSFYDYVGRQTQELVDLADKAALAGVSLKEFQESLFAARASGVSDKDFFSGFDKLSSDITQASQKTTEFGELFRQNGLSIKQTNGELITAGTALKEIMGLMEGAAPAVQQRIAQIVGLSASWIPFLKAGEDEFERLKQRAQDLGVVIDDGTIAKAREFNAQWKEAVATWDLQFKASMASILPLLTQLATLANQVLSGIGSVSGSVGRWLTPTDQMSKGQLADQINDVYRLTEMVEKLGGDISQQSTLGFKARTLAGLVGLPEDASLDQVSQLLDKLQKQYDQQPDRLRVTPNPTSTVLPDMSGGNALDKQTESIERHIAKMKADAEAVGEGAGALEHARAEALLYDAAQKAGIKNLEDYADQFYNLAERAGAAAQALARAKVDADIKFNRDTAFLSPGDVAIAQQLRGSYGSVAEALNSAQASQIRFNSTLRDLSSGIENGLVSGLTDITTGTKSVSQGFQDMAASIIRSIEQMIIKLLIVEPLMRSLQGVAGGIFGGGSALPGTAGSPYYGPVAPSAMGNVFSAGQVVPFAMGGVPDIVSSPTIAPMAMFGEAGDEGIMPLRRGSDGRLGVTAAGASGGSSVTINNYTDARPNVERSSNGDVTITLRKAVDDMVGDSLSTGTGRRVLGSQYGVKQFTGS